MRLASTLLLILAAEGAAWADPDVVKAPKPVTAEERPFVFLSDPTTPSAGVFSMGYGFGLATGVSADRPLPANLASGGASHAFSMSFGATERIAPFASVTANKDTLATGVAGVRVQFTDPASPFRFTLATAGLREGNSGAFGGWVRGAASFDRGPLRLAANVHAEKVFGARRDGLDVLAMAGVSMKVMPSLRLGGEYVGQDLEEVGGGAEGGARHFAGPNAAIDLGHAQITLGPAFGLNPASPRVVGRVGVLVSF